MSFGQSPANLNVTKYTGDQIADVPCVQNPRAPRVTDLNYPLFTLWRNSNKNAVLPDAEGDMWYLAKFTPNGSNPPLAIWLKLASGSFGDVSEFTPDSGTSPVVPDGAGNVNMVGTAGGGVTTIGSLHTITYEMKSPFSLTPFEFTQQLGIQTPASVSALVPLNIANNLTGNYITSITNLSTADNTTVGYSASNSTSNMEIGMGSTGFASNPIIQGMAFWQASTGAGMVMSVVDPTKQWNLYIGGNQMMEVQSSSGTPIVQIFNGYLNLANQSVVNSFQALAVSVPNGGSASLVTIGSGQMWLMMCCTTNASNDSTYRATAVIYGYANGANFITNLDTSKITFTNVANAISLANAGAATVTLNVTGIRLF